MGRSAINRRCSLLSAPCNDSITTISAAFCKFQYLWSQLIPSQIEYSSAPFNAAIFPDNVRAMRSRPPLRVTPHYCSRESKPQTMADHVMIILIIPSQQNLCSIERRCGGRMPWHGRLCTRKRKRKPELPCDIYIPCEYSDILLAAIKTEQSPFRQRLNEFSREHQSRALRIASFWLWLT